MPPLAQYCCHVLAAGQRANAKSFSKNRPRIGLLNTAEYGKRQILLLHGMLERPRPFSFKEALPP